MHVGIVVKGEDRRSGTSEVDKQISLTIEGMTITVRYEQEWEEHDRVGEVVLKD